MKTYCLLIVLPFILVSCKMVPEKEHPGEDELVLQWKFGGNQFGDRKAGSAFILTNNSDRTLGSSGWALYFNQPGRGIVEGSETGNIKYTHINGDLSRITPDEGFLLEPGQTVEFGYEKPGWIIKRVEAPLGPYMVYTDTAGKQLGVVSIVDYTILPFPPLEEVFPLQTDIPIPDAAWVHSQNEGLQRLPALSIGKILPTPGEVAFTGDKTVLEEGMMIHHDGEVEWEAGYLADLLEGVMGSRPPVMVSDRGGPNIIRLSTGINGDEIDPEGYRLIVSGEEGVVISAAGTAGVFYGIQSLISIIPIGYWEQPGETLELDEVNIFDEPAFAYRGMHLDLARNFNTISAIKQLIRAMGFYKMNRLHLHLTDDEGWRLQIPSLPELTDIGGFRGHTEDNLDHLIPAYGSGPEPDTTTGYGSGFLTGDQFVDILHFARDHHIEVIPEINLPGHARAAIYAMEARYRRLMAEGKEEEAEKYRLIDPEDASQYNSAQNFDDNVVCVCKEAPYLFFETVLDDLIAMYRKAGLELRVVHAGGDEVPAGSWTGSPICREFLENHPEIGGAANLQPYFEGRLFGILQDRGMVMGGWEEIAMKKNEDGKWIPNPLFAGKGMLPYVWNSLGENLDLGYRLANAEYPVVLCNVNSLYFDMAYNHHPEEPGLYWGGFVDTRNAFEFAPLDVFKSTLTDYYGRLFDPDVDFAGMERLEPGSEERIAGLQGQLWSETIKGPAMLEYYYLPKMIGLAERAWVGQPPWGDIEDMDERMENLESSWEEFTNILGQRELPRLDHLFGGFNYRLPPPGAIIDELGNLHANVAFPGLEIRYTTDGSEPLPSSPQYEGPVEVSGTVSLRTFSTGDRGSRISTAIPR